MNVLFTGAAHHAAHTISPPAQGVDYYMWQMKGVEEEQLHLTASGMRHTHTHTHVPRGPRLQIGNGN